MEFRLRVPFLSGKGEGSPKVGDTGGLLVAQQHGKYYEAAKQGQIHSHTTTPLGLAIPIYTGTALGGGALPLWNPPNSGVDVELIEVNCARASGTADFAAIGLMARRLDAIATGALMTALDESIKPVNGLLLAGAGALSSRVRSSCTGTNTVTAGAAGDFVRNLFTINLEADTGTAHATTAAKHEFDGTVIVPPGVLVYLAATKASTALYASSLVWREIPR